MADFCSTPPLSRRAALIRLAAAGLSTGITLGKSAAENDVTFFVVADPQIHLEKWGTAGTERTIKTLNELPGTDFPLGGKVAEPRAVLLPGDLVDDVDDDESWATYRRFFDPNGNALLRHRVFEGIGNHDITSTPGPDGFSRVEREFIRRNRARRGGEKIHHDPLGYHYSWDWDPLHLVNLNLFPGNEPRPVYDNPSPWNNPRKSLDFLREDLGENVGDSGRPVILMWHYGLRGWGLEKWWTPDDLANLKEVIAPYNVVLILHGHEHAYARYEWEGCPVFMCPSPQRDRDPKTPGIASTAKGFLVVRLKGGELQVAHHHDRGWGETWSRGISTGT